MSRFLVAAVALGAVAVVAGLKPLGPELVLGKRLDAQKLTREAFEELYESEVPVVLFNVFPKLDTEKWCESAVAALSEETIEYDSRDESGQVSNFEATLGEFIQSLPDNSDHRDNLYLMSEDILTLPEAEPLMRQLQMPEELFGQDLFRYFPSPIRPRCALIIGGAGARSFLHSDPYEWVGWNMLLEGSKLWTFLPPDVSLEALGARRNAPDAWGDVSLAAGRVSDVDLFSRVGLGPPLAGAEAGGKTKGKGKGKASAPQQPQQPTALNSHLIAAYQALAQGQGQRQGQGQPLSKPLCFYSAGVSANAEAEAEASPSEAALTPAQLARCIQVQQREGEVVVIPPGWWHQVYHLAPSVAVAGQYFNSAGRARVFRHILDWCARGPDSEEGGGGERAGAATGEETTAPAAQDPAQAAAAAAANAARTAAVLRELPLLASDEARVLRVIEEGLAMRRGPKAAKAALEALLAEAKAQAQAQAQARD